ncbi:MAG: hypothetical protein K8S18_09505 [Desulfobacula sp.]|nr:hypothetical protein [Desulfobacula sp.]
MIKSRSKNIFIHSLFRTGSTYFWSTLKKNKNAVCYYEPLNEQLLDKNKIFILDNINSNRHSGLVEHYFSDYKDAGDRFKYLKKPMVIDEFCNVISHKLLKAYINYLIKVNHKTHNIFQFNRTSLRSKWFKKNFPESQNIYLYRNHKDQWKSIVDQHFSGNPYFLNMNLLSVSKNLNHAYFKPLLSLVHFPDIPYYKNKNATASFNHDYNHSCHYVFYLTLEEHYLIHYYLWKIGYNYNRAHCNICIDMTRLNNDPEYQDEISIYFKSWTGFKPVFRSIKLPGYSEFSINKMIMEKIESLVDKKLEQLTI